MIPLFALTLAHQVFATPVSYEATNGRFESPGLSVEIIGIARFDGVNIEAWDVNGRVTAETTHRLTKELSGKAFNLPFGHESVLVFLRTVSEKPLTRYGALQSSCLMEVKSDSARGGIERLEAIAIPTYVDESGITFEYMATRLEESVAEIPIHPRSQFDLGNAKFELGSFERVRGNPRVHQIVARQISGFVPHYWLSISLLDKDRQHVMEEFGDAARPKHQSGSRIRPGSFDRASFVGPNLELTTSLNPQKAKFMRIDLYQQIEIDFHALPSHPSGKQR